MQEFSDLLPMSLVFYQLCGDEVICIVVRVEVR